MAMRETERSLRWYFLLAGGFATISSLRGLGSALHLPPLPTSWMIGVWLPLLTYLGFGIGYIAAGVRLRVALAGDPSWIKRMLLASGGALVVELALVWILWGDSRDAAVRAGFTSATIRTVIGLAITWYLYANVSRMSRESKAATASVFE